MGNQTPKSLPADRRSIRSRQSSGRTTYQRTGRRSTPGRASSVPISSGSPVNALGSEPGPQTGQPAPYTRRNTSFDPDDLRSPRPSAAFPLNATPEREFDPDSDLADYEDTPGRTASNGVLPPLVSLGHHPHGPDLRLGTLLVPRRFHAPPRLPRPTTTTRDLLKRIRKKSPLERMIRRNSSTMTMTLAEMFSSRGTIS